LSAWTPFGALHDTGKIVLDLAVSLAVGGDCPAYLAVLRGQPRLFATVASDPTMSRRVDALAGDVDTAAPRSEQHGPRPAPLKRVPPPHEGSLPVDIDATILTSRYRGRRATRQTPHSRDGANAA